MNGYSNMPRRMPVGSLPTPADSNYGSPGPIPPMSVLMMNAQKEPEREMPRYNPLNAQHPRSSSLLNVQDSVAMHLLMETAMSDSAEYEVLSFEEVEELKKEHILLMNRIEATRRKLALESKLRDAAQSLNRLYSSKDGKNGSQNGPDGAPRSPTRTRRSLLGRKSADSATLSKTDDEFSASVRKCEDLAQELWRLEERDQELKRRIVEHTAGILQMTHRGLKKNIRKDELPRSPESMASYKHQSMPRFDGTDDFDDRSLYRPTDYVDEYDGRRNGGSNANMKAVEEAERRLELLAEKVQHMMEQLDSGLSVEPPVFPPSNAKGQIGAQLPARIDHLEKSLDAIGLAQARNVGTNQKTIGDSEDQLKDINNRLWDLLTLSNHGTTPVVPPPDESANLRAQLSFVGLALGQLKKRVEHFVEQKAILTTQIQQQRELNSKSDAQRDTQITQLMEQLSEAKTKLTSTEQEAHTTRDQVEMLEEQLDEARQQINLREQQRFMDESKALQAERDIHKTSIQRLEKDVETKQKQLTEFEAVLSTARNEISAKTLLHEQQVRELTAAKEQAEIEAKRNMDELSALEGEVVRAQTELTVVRAELDGAYGTRAQRAADVSSNPAIQKEIDSLNDKNEILVKQLENIRDESIKTETALNEKNTTLLRELETYKAELESSRKGDEINLELIERNASLVQELDTARNQYDRARKDLEVLRSNPPPTSSQRDSGDLQTKVNLLQKELKDTIDDYELMTKASIEFERERDQLEVLIEGLRERCDTLESQLSDERVRWLGLKSPATMSREGSTSTELTSTIVLKNEFKKMMRDTRAENMKALRAEQEERRRLEGLVKNMRKDQQQLLVRPNQSKSQ